MHPLRNGSQATVRPAAKPLSGSPGWFTESGDNNRPSYPGADWFNHVIAEFANTLAACGVVFDPAQDNNLAKAFESIQKVIGDFVTPEMFGLVGEEDNDNHLFEAAAATGKPIKAFGAEYNFNQSVFESSLDLEFGENTVVNNVQASGAKQPSIRCVGAGRVGTVMTVTAIGTGLYREITVDDASDLSVGDTVEMRETAELRLEVGVSSPSMQDFNYYEYFTVESIVGDSVTFEEYVGGKFDIGNGVRLSKVEFLENCNIRGGIHKGNGFGGGGVGLKWCRKSIVAVKAQGVGGDLGINQRFGGAAGLLTDCWECDLTINYAQWCLFSAFVTRIQSCNVEVKGGKRTSNGGLIVESARKSLLTPAAQDNPGDTSGDGMGVSGRTWGCTFGPLTIGGAKCHTTWVRQPVKHNTFLPITSINSITSVLNLYGDDNVFICVKAVGSPGVTFEGSGNTVHLEYDGPGNGAFFAAGTSRNKLTGRSRTTATTGDFDVLIGGEITYTTIDMDCGERGLGYGSEVKENHSNNIDIRGPKPYRLGSAKTTRGYVWSDLLTDVTSTPQALLVPGDAGDTNGLRQLTAPTQDIPDIFKITLKTTNFLPDTYSEYLLTGGQSTWDVSPLTEGVSGFAPRLENASGTIFVRLNTEAGPANMAIQIEKF
ncbi:hypothetical protein [Rheinheimera faecalis]|uniref:hypothetical protein n=1 Tax=Rheinheimera faecalis TaxID=2901141 RepID=UPI001E46FC8E|nr:hypothetical protein [Rheinheimera faecalis]